MIAGQKAAELHMAVEVATGSYKDTPRENIELDSARKNLDQPDDGPTSKVSD